jgi:putative oligomerization/nucleic acid binding protein
VRYAYFPAARRLAVRQGDRSSLHDTGTHRISGVSQSRQGAGGALVFSTDRGPIGLQDLPLVDADAGTVPRRAPPPAGADAPAAAEVRRPVAGGGAGPGGDPLALIERLAELHAKGILTAEEFAAKKAELLGRL